MAESERLLAREDSAIREQKISPDQPHEPRGKIPFLRRHELDGAAVEGLPFYRAALKHCALLDRKLIEPGGKQRLDGRRDNNLVVARLADQREDLLYEQRIASGDRLDPFSQ